MPLRKPMLNRFTAVMRHLTKFNNVIMQECQHCRCKLCCIFSYILFVILHCISVYTCYIAALTNVHVHLYFLLPTFIFPYFTIFASMYHDVFMPKVVLLWFLELWFTTVGRCDHSMEHRARGLPNLICNNLKFKIDIHFLCCYEVYYLINLSENDTFTFNGSPWLNTVVVIIAPLTLVYILSSIPPQTAMKVGLALAQCRDDSTDVGSTLGQPTILFGYVAAKFAHEL